MRPPTHLIDAPTLISRRTKYIGNLSGTPLSIGGALFLTYILDHLFACKLITFDISIPETRKKIYYQRVLSPHLTSLNLNIIIIKHLDRVFKVDPSQKWFANRISNEILYIAGVLFHLFDRICQVLVFLLGCVSLASQISQKMAMLDKPV